MIHFLITAGGTIENIDDIRKITNTSTGELGSCIYAAMIQQFQEVPELDYFIHYVLTKTAVIPVIQNEHRENVKLYFVDNTRSVVDCIENILATIKLDYIVHSMAISDFTVDCICPIERLTKELIHNIEGKNPEDYFEIIENTLRDPQCKLNNQTKLHSNSDLLMSMKRTPKVIELFKKVNKGSCLVGFKLLKNVSEEELVTVATEMAKKTGCDYVLANDYSTVQAGKHEGLLLESGKVIGRFVGKEQIAAGIVKNLIRRMT